MYTMAEKQIDTVLGLVEGTEVGREDELHSAICLQGVERSRESVIRNLVQDRKCIRYQNTASRNR